MLKKRRSLNLRSFQVFDAVARLRSIKDAAAELGITPSAVSHQLRNLSLRTGKALIERRGRDISLTDDGASLARSLKSAFDIIEQEATSLDGDLAVVRLGVYSSFAVSWLIPRLPRFLEAYPHIDLRLIMLYDPHETSSRIADIFITSEPVQIGYAARRLFGEQLIPVCAATGPENFAAPMRFISAEAETGLAGRAWEAFALLNDLDTSSIQWGDWLCCSHYIFALEMAQLGMGAALLPDFMAARHLADGTLRRLPGTPLPTGQSYELHVPVERRQDPSIGHFSSWLQRTIAEAPLMN